MQRRMTLAAVAVAGAMTLTGCGGGGEETPAAPTESETVASEQPTQAPAPTEAAKPKSKERIYKVRSGDTLSAIAERFDTTVRAIVRANKLKNRNQLQVGQRLKIPAGG